MACSSLIANTTFEPYVPSPNLLLPVAVGVFAGLGLVGLIHFFGRMRQRAALARAGAQASTETDEQPTSDPFVHGSGSEQRKAFRRVGNPIEVSVVNVTSQGPQLKGYVVNRSVGGLGLQMENSFDVLTELRIRPINAPPIAPWVEVVVRNVHKADRGFEIGCQFVKIPPWPVLMLFG
jgi:PilZ domain